MTGDDIVDIFLRLAARGFEVWQIHSVGVSGFDVVHDVEKIAGHTFSL